MNKTLKAEQAVSGADIIAEIPVKDFKKKKVVNVLWTGGFDSTLRMLELSKLDLDIQPFYLSDKRHSEPKERRALSEILKDIENHPETRCNILPIINYKVSELEPDKELSEAYKRLHANHLIGIQLDWLGRFAKLVPGIELTVEKSLLGRTYNCILQNGSIVKKKEGNYGYYLLDKRNTHPDLYKVFGNFHFPALLFESTKLEMINIYKELGFEHVLLKTWFCHTPLKNEPCGVCTPCKAVMLEGLSFRLPQKAIARYHYYSKYGHTRWYKLFFKIRLKISETF